MIVYDVTDPGSFENVTYWLDEVDKHAGPDVCKLLVGNKSDLSETRAISEEAAEQLAKDRVSISSEGFLRNFETGDVISYVVCGFVFRACCSASAARRLRRSL